MSTELKIRASALEDRGSIEAMYPEAFPEEDLLPLLHDLLRAKRDTTSLVAVVGSRVVGHVVFTSCGVAGHREQVSLLGPLAVAPDRQGQGIGSALVRAGLEALEAANFRVALVLGDPAYYGRFGFRPESSIDPPYPLPEEWRGAWQSLSLGEETTSSRGRLSVPGPWNRPGLWAP